MRNLQQKHRINIHGKDTGHIYKRRQRKKTYSLQGMPEKNPGQGKDFRKY